MAIEVNETLTRQVAHLARLELSDAEAQTFASQLGGILKYVEQLSTLDVSAVEPLTHPLDLATPMREDVVVPSPVDASGKPKVLASGPDVLDDGYKVPPIL
jgi:aspartyl-tRNA(Asn)/glutamyl-tRNA(Gln) amidotransferase subunit C